MVFYQHGLETTLAINSMVYYQHGL